MTKILITGGAGFIGSSLAAKLIQNPDNQVVLLDNLLTGLHINLPNPSYKNWKFVKADVNNYQDLSAVMLSYSFDYVFHYAAVVGVQRTLANPTKVLEDIQGLRNVLDLSKNTGVKRVFYASSSEVYGESVSYPQDEINTPLNSRLPYAVVKNLGEAFFTSYQKEYDLTYTIFRFFNTYGPKQSTDFVMSKFVTAALQNKPLTIYGDGSQSRTFCYIEDNVGACLTAFYDDKYLNDVVNIGNDKETSILELAETIIKVTNSQSEIIHVAPLKEGDMRRRCPNLKRMNKLLTHPRVSLEEGISRMIASGNFDPANKRIRAKKIHTF